MPGPEYLVLHHGACPRSWTVEDVERSHKARGFRTTGYHDLVRQDEEDGAPVEIQGGRPYDNGDDWEPWEAGAHVKGKNSVAYGVCLIGNFDVDPIPDSMLRAAADLFAVQSRRWPGARIVGHRELAATACPGRYIDLDHFRSMVSARLDG